MAEQNILHFEQFYFGNLISTENRASATTGVIARTPGIKPEHAIECVQLAKLRPPMPGEASDAMPSAIGVFKGSRQSADFIIAKAQRNSAGLPQIVYLLVPSSALRKLGGNVRILQAFGMAGMPTYAEVDKKLGRFSLDHAAPPSADVQSDALMDLLIFCQDSFANIEGVLAAVVQGWPLAIVNSPSSLDNRLQFLQGLLSLLPAPARSGITFATHVSDFKTSQAQIKFASKSDIPEKHVVFDWQHGTLRTPAPDDTYSHYIVAQLRLDPSQAIQETDRLARTAVWRAMHRENLSTALEWVSRRAALDQTVQNNQPADREMVTAVLREDPTLPDDLRPVYVRHVLAFTLALKEPDSADIVAAQCATYRKLAPKVIEQLRAVLDNNQPRLVYTILERWILRVPESEATQWHSLLHTAAKTHVAALVEAGQPKRAQRFLAYLNNASPLLRMQNALGDIVRETGRAAQLDSDLAQQLFLLGAEYLSVSELNSLLNTERFAKQLPQPLQTVLGYFKTGPGDDSPPEHLLHHGAHAFGDGYRMQVLTRLVELTVLHQRTELIDTPALQALLVMTQSPQSEQYHDLTQRVIDDIIERDGLRQLAPPGPRILIQLMLQTHDYEHAVAMLEYYQNTIFGTENLDDFNRVIDELFSFVALPPDDLTQALSHFEGSQIRTKVRAMVYASSLKNREWSTELDYAAKQLTTILFNDFTMIESIGTEHVMRLLEYYARPHNALDAMRVATGLIDYIISGKTDDAALIPRIWPLITWDEEVTTTAIELLRRFVRGLPLRKAAAMISYLGGELGKDIQATLQATYVLRFLVDEADLFEAAADIHTAASLFADLATTYHSHKELPTITRLRRDLDTMTGGLSTDERHDVADKILLMGTQLYELGTQRTRKWHVAAEIQPLIKGTESPKNSGELLYFTGGHFAQQKAYPLNLNREEMAHLFGTRSAAMLLREINSTTRLLKRLLQASEHLRRMSISPIALHAELNSLWDMLSLYNKRQIQDQLARDCQHLAAVIDVIANNASDRAIGSTNITRQLDTGKRQPQSALETLRWIHGYFAHKHVR